MVVINDLRRVHDLHPVSLVLTLTKSVLGKGEYPVLGVISSLGLSVNLLCVYDVCVCTCIVPEDPVLNLFSGIFVYYIFPFHSYPLLSFSSYLLVTNTSTFLVSLYDLPLIFFLIQNFFV